MRDLLWAFWVAESAYRFGLTAESSLELALCLLRRRATPKEGR